MTLPPAPNLLAHETWVDEDGYHARYKTALPDEALAAGCAQLLHADTAQELTQAAVHNRIRIEAWKSSLNFCDETPFTAGDLT